MEEKKIENSINENVENRIEKIKKNIEFEIDKKYLKID